MSPINFKRSDSIISCMNIVLQLLQHGVILAKGEATTGHVVATILNNCPTAREKMFCSNKTYLGSNKSLCNVKLIT